MQVILNMKNIHLEEPAAVALGFFDGVHNGHRAVISAAVKSGLVPVVFTFAQHPRAFFGDPPELISDLDDRLACFEQLGVRIAVAAEFDDFAAADARAFYAFLRDKLCMRAAFFGYNYRFGRGREGDGGLLAQLCGEDGIAHEQLAPVSSGGEPISSSRIRAAMNEGDIAAASEMLGRGIMLTAQVGNGKNLGRKFGFATINQPLTAPVKPLLRGVYASEVKLDGKTWPAVTNFGARPTVLQSEEAAETHIIGFEGDLYGQPVSVRFLKYLRPQQKFDNVKQLREQICKDVAATLEWRKPQ